MWQRIMSGLSVSALQILRFKYLQIKTFRHLEYARPKFKIDLLTILESALADHLLTPVGLEMMSSELANRA